MTLGGRIKELRNQRGISQKKLGSDLELSDSIITQIVRKSHKSVI